MNGPDHYRVAEQLLREAADVESANIDLAPMLAQAQVHATLALAAATALASAGLPADGDTARAWRRATSVPKIPVQAAPSPSGDYECCASGSCEVCRR